MCGQCRGLVDGGGVDTGSVETQPHDALPAPGVVLGSSKSDVLCRHHHTLVHDHGYRMAPAPGGGFAFLRPDGVPIPRAGAPTAGTPDLLVTAGVAAGIDDRTITPLWGGERLDRDHVLTWLLPAGARERAA